GDDDRDVRQSGPVRWRQVRVQLQRITRNGCGPREHNLVGLAADVQRGSRNETVELIRSDVARARARVMTLVRRQTESVIASIDGRAVRTDGHRLGQPAIAAEHAQKQVGTGPAAGRRQREAIVINQVVAAVSNRTRGVAAEKAAANERILQREQSALAGDAAAEVRARPSRLTGFPHRTARRSAAAAGSTLRAVVGYGAIDGGVRPAGGVESRAAFARASPAAVTTVAAKSESATVTAIAAVATDNTVAEERAIGHPERAPVVADGAAAGRAPGGAARTVHFTDSWFAIAAVGAGCHVVVERAEQHHD